MDFSRSHPSVESHMSGEDTCDAHTWASVGITTRERAVCRIWECEQCQVWTAEPFTPDLEVAWTDTWLSER
jgi:ribosomal protein L37AE/L43A